MRRLDPPALYAALAAERQQRRLTWVEVARQSGVADATIRRLRSPGRFEADGVIALAAWLGRPVEEFTRDAGPPPSQARGDRDPTAPTGGGALGSPD